MKDTFLSEYFKNIFTYTYFRLIYVSLKGGQGSGNFGHAGRPGEVGGSGAGGKGRYNNGKPYYRWTNQDTSPMSDWGHAMFMNNYDQEAAAGYGRHLWEFSPSDSAISFQEIENDFSNYLQELIDKGYYENDADGWFQTWIDGINDGTYSLQDIVNTFNPSDIVDAALAYDNSTGVMLMYEFLESRGYSAIITADGAIVFDENSIVRNRKLDR